jgi:Mn-dependent DtxR family transcriptional regulator
MSGQNEFYTLKGYSLMYDENMMTYAMEDYLEMIYRISAESQVVRIKHLSELLHVKPPSASKMAAILKEKGFLEFEKYGHITLTEKGELIGESLLYRHNLLHQFFCFINHSENELALVENIEHYIDDHTVENIKKWLNQANAEH